MRAILILTPYILIPLIITLFFKRFNYSDKSLIYILTGSIIFLYPFAFFWVEDYLNPPSGFRCGNPRFAFLVVNLIILLPITLLIQYIFNTMMLTNESETEENIDSTKKSYFDSEDEEKYN
jgi:cellulose synthase/poly-beta-1,6-N-acetylglucosamine synthase-like glycosyltransferase